MLEIGGSVDWSGYMPFRAAKKGQRMRAVFFAIYLIFTLLTQLFVSYTGLFLPGSLYIPINYF